MKKFIVSAVIGAAALLGASANAASLGLKTDPTIQITESAVSIGNDVGFFGFELYGNGTASGPLFGSGLDVTITGLIEPGFHEGSLNVAGLLGGDLLQSGFVGTDAFDLTDKIELLFGNLTGSAASIFGNSVLVTLFGEFGASPFETGFAASAGELYINAVAPVPLPATLPLLASVLLGGAAWRRRAVKHATA